MSRAFVKEPDGGGVEDLPERPISPHPNLVTAEGLAAIEAAIDGLRQEQGTVAEDRAAAARIARDLRYWQARRASAQVTEPPVDRDQVRFGSTVTLRRDDGRLQKFRIVGEDEADPTKGTIAYVSPVAQALIGKAVGDEVRAGQTDAEIVAIG